MTLFPRWLLSAYRHPLTSLAILLFVPWLTLCVWLCAGTERQWRAQAEGHLLVAARLASRIIEEELTRTRALEEAFAARPDIREALRHGDHTRINAILRTLIDVTPMTEAVTVRQGQAAPEPVSGVYLRDDASGEKVITISSPVRDGQQLVGTLQAQYRLEELARWLEKVRVEPEGFLYVVDQRGRLVLHPFQLLPGPPKDVSAWAPVAASTVPHGTVIRFRQGDPPRGWTAAMAPVASCGWRVVAQQPDDAILAPLRRVAWSCAALLLILIGVVVALAMRWAHLHHATLELVAQQARLLKASEQQRVKATLHRTEHPDATGPSM